MGSQLTLLLSLVIIIFQSYMMQLPMSQFLTKIPKNLLIDSLEWLLRLDGLSAGKNSSFHLSSFTTHLATKLELRLPQTLTNSPLEFLESHKRIKMLSILRTSTQVMTNAEDILHMLFGTRNPPMVFLRSFSSVTS